MSREASICLEEVHDPNQAQREVNKVVSLAPTSAIQSASRNPYSFSVKKCLSRELLLCSESPERSKKNKAKQRSRSMWGVKSERLNPSVVKDASKSSTLSMSPSSKSCSSDYTRGLTSPILDRFVVPREVFLIPIWQTERIGLKTSGLWEFELLSEEEVSSHYCII